MDVISKNPALSSLLIKSALQSPCKYHIGAIAFDKKGDILGNTCNTFRGGECFIGTQDRRGTGLHAEARLIRRYGRNIKTILIMRIGRSGDILPIDPCPSCAKIAANLGIDIITVLGREDADKK